ncbi:MAG: hypothetical protein CSA49_05280 [Gammaproteobacteria bacterium]|nr:MAG: hypothetical protein CSA49_05280 [Gammaproteobacteria bacterium]
MDLLKTRLFAFCALVVLSGAASAQVINVDLDDADYYRPFYSPELVNVNGQYQASFTDTFVFTLAESGSLSFTLSEKDSRGGFFNEWVDITSVGFESGLAPTSVTPWEKADPYYNGSNLESSFSWDWLAAGTYNLLVAGEAVASSYPQTHYWMNDVAFVANPNNPNPVPEPATLLLLGAGLLGMAGARNKKRNG